MEFELVGAESRVRGEVFEDCDSFRFIDERYKGCGILGVEEAAFGLDVAFKGEIS